MKNKIGIIEDISPLTIIKVAVCNKIVILNCDSDNENIHKLQLPQFPYKDLNQWMDKNISPIKYGIGNSILDAFVDYKYKNKN